MSEQFKSVFKDEEEPKIIEVPNKPPMVEINGMKHLMQDLMSNKFKKMIANKSIGCQTDEIFEEIADDKCGCTTCCFDNRKNDPEYLREFDEHPDDCICEIKHEKVNYRFMIPFVISLSLGVMQFGSFYVDLENEQK
jgi:hypothetical protein